MRIEVLTRIWLVTLAAAACSSSRKTHPDYPAIMPGETPPPEVASGDKAAAPPPTFPESGSACMPAGVYTVTFDLSAAKFMTTGGMDDAFCKNMAVAVPAKKLRWMKISYPDGKLTVQWPGTQIATARGECAFDIGSRTVPAKIVFAAGHGTGTSDFAIGVPNHTDESCNVTGATLTVEPAPHE